MTAPFGQPGVQPVPGQGAQPGQQPAPQQGQPIQMEHNGGYTQPAPDLRHVPQQQAAQPALFTMVNGQMVPFSPGLPQQQAPQAPQPMQPQPQTAPGFGQPALGQGNMQFGAPTTQQFQQVPVRGMPAQQQLAMNPAAIIQPGPGVPVQLVGRTVGEALQAYETMRQQQIQQQPRQPQQAAPTAPPQAQQPSAGSNFWLDPEGSISRIVEQRVGQIMAPQQMAALEQQLSTALPHFQQLRPRIMATMQNLDPTARTNPEAWTLAHKLAYADAVMAGERFNGAQPQAQAPAAVQSFQAPSPLAQGPQNMQTQQPWQPAFVEAPTAGADPSGSMHGVLTPEKAAAARKLGISDQEYLNAERGIY